MNHEHKTVTLLGGKTIPVIFDDGKIGELKVTQFKLRDYQRVFQISDDEFALVAAACQVPKEAILTLTPESYELALTATREVNAQGFFVYAGRQMERAAVNLRQMPLALLDKFMAQKSTSRTPSPIMPPPAG